jgi:ParB family chromosome partitioning protein
LQGHLTTIRLEHIQPHPDNPRLYPREDLISDLATHLREQGQFLPEYALLVRPMPDGTYQIISGHHRYAAAQRAGLTTIPCWCREMGDAEAHMELALANRQDALSPLEWGLHAPAGVGVNPGDCA